MKHFEHVFAKFNQLMLSVWLRLMVGLGLARRPEPALVRVRSRRAGAGMLEYALVALISIAVFGVLIEQFTGIFSSLAETIGDRLGGA